MHGTGGVGATVGVATWYEVHNHESVTKNRVSRDTDQGWEVFGILGLGLRLLSLEGRIRDHGEPS